MSTREFLDAYDAPIHATCPPVRCVRATLGANLYCMGTEVSHGERLTEYLENEWNALGTTRGAWCRTAGLSASTVMRWSQGAEPDLRNLRIVAAGLDRNLVDILFAAGYIDERDARMRRVAPPRPRLDIEVAIKTDRSISVAERDALLAVHAAFSTLGAAAGKSR